jgi:DUF4097 and DUF4098 domain-containing protein YvlB
MIQGGIVIRGTDRKDILVETRGPRKDSQVDTPDASGLRRIAQPASLAVEEENNRVRISTGMPDQFYNLTIEVPAKTNLEISTVNGGDISVDGVDGELEIGNVNGGITLTRVSGSVVAHTTNGDVKVALLRVTPQKSMAFTTLNGDIDLTLPVATKANLKLREWVLTSSAGELLKVPSAAYVLSGNTLTGDYPLKIQADGPLKLKAVTDRGSFSADVAR